MFVFYSYLINISKIFVIEIFIILNEIFTLCLNLYQKFIIIFLINFDNYAHFRQMKKHFFLFF